MPRLFASDIDRMRHEGRTESEMDEAMAEGELDEVHGGSDIGEEDLRNLLQRAGYIACWGDSPDPSDLPEDIRDRCEEVGILKPPKAEPR